MNNSVMITGLGNGILGDCAPCNYNANQLILNPSMFLWLDKISIPQKIWNSINVGVGVDERIDKIVKIILEAYERAGLIDIINTDDIFTEQAIKFLEYSVEKDIELLKSINPKYAECEEKEFVIQYKGFEYCFPRLLAIYADLFLSKSINANCLFDDYELNFCELKFGLTQLNPLNTANMLNGVDKIISNIIPSIHPIPMFLSEKVSTTQCNSCKNQLTCEDKYFSMLEKSMKQYAEWREYDEFYLLRENIERIIKEVSSHSDIILPTEIFDEFKSEKHKINKMIHTRLPQVKKFSNLITILSVPAAISSAAISAPLPITLGLITLSSLPAITSTMINYFEEKYKWVNFSLKN